MRASGFLAESCSSDHLMQVVQHSAVCRTAGRIGTELVGLCFKKATAFSVSAIVGFI